jgi:hypothetical protein
MKLPPVNQLGPRASLPVRPPEQEPLIEEPAVEKKLASAPAAEVEKSPPRAEPARAVPGISLHQMFEQHSDLPRQAAILGVCEDGLPVLLDLADPAPGAVLVIGDEREEQLEILRTAVSSLAMRNTPRSVQILVISHQPQSWKSWIAERGLERYCMDILGSDDAAIREWVLRLADWTEQRRLGQRSGPPILLVMDTVSFVSRLAYDVRLNFEWMVKEAPPAQIWPVGALSTELARTLGTRTLRSFQTRLLGFSREAEAYIPLTGLDENEVDCFRQPGQFAVQVGEKWLRFRALRSR